MNILFLRAGNFSNLNHYLYQALCQSHNVIQNVNAGKVIRRRRLQLSSWLNILHTIIHSKRYWKQTHSKNSFAFSRMTKYCNQFVRSCTDYDIIFQTQCKFSITENPYSRPYYIYTDLTQKLTDRIWPRWALKGSSRETRAWYQMESEAFHRADKIFTFNNYVKSSFVDDYNIDPEKVIVVGSGINYDFISEIDFDRKFNYGFTLFFLATEFERQGGPTVVEAFKLIKTYKLDINLIIGGKSSNHLPEGIETHNHLTNDTIEKFFNRTLIFLMPARIGGLQSVLQAMSKKCVCIGCNCNLLLNDILKDNQTGFVIPINNPTQLAEKIIELYNNESLMKKIANQAYSFVKENFTWFQIIKKMTPHFEI